MKNYIVICKQKKIAKAKLALLCNPKQIEWQRSDRYTAEIAALNGDMYYWVTPSRNRKSLLHQNIVFERAYIECKTDINSVFYNDILAPITKHEEFFDGSELGADAFSVKQNDMEAIWNQTWGCNR